MVHLGTRGVDGAKRREDRSCGGVGGEIWMVGDTTGRREWSGDSRRGKEREKEEWDIEMVI